MRRGLAQSEDGDDPQLRPLIASGFRISGLGQWVEAGIEADRLLVFGD
jgi:tRNA 2-thiouridine synthesizing protein D